MIFIKKQIFEIIEVNKILKLEFICEQEVAPDKSNSSTIAGKLFNLYRDTVLTDLLETTKKIHNEGCYMITRDMKVLHSLAEAYEFEPLMAWFERYWDMWILIKDMSKLEAEAKFWINKDYERRKVIKDFKIEIELTDNYKDLKQSKINHLQKEITNLSSHAKVLEKKFKAMEDRDVESWVIDLKKDFTNYNKLKGKIKSKQISIAHLKGEYKKDKTFITDEMIEEAKRVPFNKLLKLEVMGNRAKALCPFHNEKTPSFIVYADSNRGHCHGCGRNVDTIQFIIETKNLKFNEAILYLLNY